MVATNPKQWKKAISGVELTLPSGNVCLARRVDLRKLLKAGQIPNSLMDIVNRALKGKSVSMESFAEDIDVDPQKLNDMLEFMDQVVIDCVLQPKVLPVPMREKKVDGLVQRDDDGKPVMEVVPFDERDDETIRIDEVDDDDKAMVFNFSVGGTSDLERFREQQAAGVESVHAGASASSSSERSDGDQG